MPPLRAPSPLLVLLVAALTVGSVTAAGAPPADPSDLVSELRRMRWRVEQLTVDCGAEPCPEDRWVEVREAAAPLSAPGPRLSLHEPTTGLLAARRVRLATRLLGEMVQRVEAARREGSGWLLDEGPRASKGLDGLHTPKDLVRMVERLLRPRAEVPGSQDRPLDDGLRRLLESLAGHRPFSEGPALARALREMAARVGPVGNPVGPGP